MYAHSDSSSIKVESLTIADLKFSLSPCMQVRPTELSLLEEVRLWHARARRSASLSSSRRAHVWDIVAVHTDAGPAHGGGGVGRTACALHFAPVVMTVCAGKVFRRGGKISSHGERGGGHRGGRGEPDLGVSLPSIFFSSPCLATSLIQMCWHRRDIHCVKDVVGADATYVACGRHQTALYCAFRLGRCENKTSEIPGR